MNTQEQQYIRGFNHGYLLTKHVPDLVGKLTMNMQPATNEYFEGFVSGKEEYELEYSLGQLNELDDIRNRSEDKERDIEKE